MVFGDRPRLVCSKAPADVSCPFYSTDTMSCSAVLLHSLQCSILRQPVFPDEVAPAPQIGALAKYRLTFNFLPDR